MSAPPYMKLFWGDYHKATRHLTRDQHGAYFLLIGEAWRLGGSLPDDDQLLAAWSLCSAAEWAEVKPIITAFFALRRGKWVHDRVRDELAAYEATSRKRKEAGRKGGSARPGKDGGNSEAIALQKPTKPEPEPEPEPDNTPIAPKGAAPDKPTRRKPKRAIPDGFPTDEHIAAQQAKAQSVGAKVDATYQAERLRNWAIYNDARYADWPQFWVNWMTKAINDAPKGPVYSAKPTPPADMDAVWRRRVGEFTRNLFWNDDWCERPGRPGCTVPRHILDEFDLGGAAVLPFPQPDRRSA